MNSKSKKQGKDVVKPKDLQVIDSEADVIVTDKEGNTFPIRKNRDIIRRWKNRTNLAVLAIENQTNINNTMPVRMMLYDALAYDEQLRANHKEKRLKNGKEPTGDYHSTFSKVDKIYPVISIVFYYGEAQWNSNIKLFDMFKCAEDDFIKDKLLEYTPNYKINLLDAHNVEMIGKYKTDLQMVFGMLKCSYSKEDIKDYFTSNESLLKNVSKETVDVVNSLMMEDILQYSEKGEGVNMCKAFRELIEEATAEGRTSEKKNFVINLLLKNFSISDICSLAECDEEFVYQVKSSMV